MVKKIPRMLLKLHHKWVLSETHFNEKGKGKQKSCTGKDISRLNI
jgi:hypothetical protein